VSPDHRARSEISRHAGSRYATVEGPIHRTNYAEIHARALKVSQRLERDGIKLGDRVATIAWNTWRHLECWYGIMGIGAICHTVNRACSRSRYRGSSTTPRIAW
jgi:acyl-CoA synthetase (AMP-forming)/AMP-acid ligase II